MVDQSHKGREYPSVTYTFDATKVREFLLAIGDENPDYYEDGAPLPPTFPTLVSFWAGGGLEKALEAIDVNIWNVLHAEEEYDYSGTFHVGDTVTAKTHIADIYERTGSTGLLTFVSFVTEFVNQHGEEVVKGTSLMIVREA